MANQVQVVAQVFIATVSTTIKVKREIIMVTTWPDTWGVFGQKKEEKIT